MTLSPILKALSTIRLHQVRHLLMGGQACILYGAAEFSRDADLAVVADTDNLARLGAALRDLGASVVAVPPFERQYLLRGHAVHFRCGRADVAGLRIDVMSRMRGVPDFDELWDRRTSIVLQDADGGELAVDVMALPDLVLAKKTQRDKDWPMIRRLVEADYAAHATAPGAEQARFWLRELRTPELLVAVARAWPDDAAEISAVRTAVHAACEADTASVEAALAAEQDSERNLDRAYWAPLRAELERLRREQGS